MIYKSEQATIDTHKELIIFKNSEWKIWYNKVNISKESGIPFTIIKATKINKDGNLGKWETKARIERNKIESIWQPYKSYKLS